MTGPGSWHFRSFIIETNNKWWPSISFHVDAGELSRIAGDAHGDSVHGDWAQELSWP